MHVCDMLSGYFLSLVMQLTSTTITIAVYSFEEK